MNVSVADEGFCSAPSNSDSYSNSGHMYWKVTNPTLAPSHLEGLVAPSHATCPIIVDICLSCAMCLASISTHHVRYLATLHARCHLHNTPATHLLGLLLMPLCHILMSIGACSECYCDQMCINRIKDIQKIVPQVTTKPMPSTLALISLTSTLAFHLVFNMTCHLTCHSHSWVQDLPGFTRSVYKRDHALITPESHVFSPLPEWTNTLGAYLITPAMGSHFVMYLANMQGLGMDTEGSDDTRLEREKVDWFLISIEGDLFLRNEGVVLSDLLMREEQVHVLKWGVWITSHCKVASELQYLIFKLGFNGKQQRSHFSVHVVPLMWSSIVFCNTLEDNQNYFYCTGNSRSGLPPYDVERLCLSTRETKHQRKEENTLKLERIQVYCLEESFASISLGYALRALKSRLPWPNRFVFVVQGTVTLTNVSDVNHKLMVDSYAYLPPNSEHSISCDASATLVVFERRYASLKNHITEQIVGSTVKQPLLETPGEVFELRKLLPTSAPYDFNIHIMDFQPGEFLNVKEVHYNQHGLLLLEGQGIYRLGDSWYEFINLRV
ncbi:(S)-ureidoglycine aminohydrolase [Vitis vinifera]|uniref:(S)-ureidoglycine aminohydrolase n=1 Tax=Vitis vinifera TaxID=29760 RepID=A0A438ESX1_VITVI|nr:(S)-ureidoglycine aminohydrolase [Vitis vinifera]